NELGEIPIDHMLVDTPQAQIALVHSDCICCAVGNDLEQSLQNLFMRRARGLVPRFSSVVIETSGVVSPGPLLRELSSRSLLAKNYRLGGVVTLADGLDAGDALRNEIEAADQV